MLCITLLCLRMSCTCHFFFSWTDQTHYCQKAEIIRQSNISHPWVSFDTEESFGLMDYLGKFLLIYRGFCWWTVGSSCQTKLSIGVRLLVQYRTNPKPEEHWSCIAHLRAEDMLLRKRSLKCWIEVIWTKVDEWPWSLVLIKLHVLI